MIKLKKRYRNIIERWINSLTFTKLYYIGYLGEIYHCYYLTDNKARFEIQNYHYSEKRSSEGIINLLLNDLYFKELINEKLENKPIIKYEF